MIDPEDVKIGNYIGYYIYGEEEPVYDTIKSIYYNDEDESYHFEFDKPNLKHCHLTKEGVFPIPITGINLEKLGFIKEKDHICNNLYFKKIIDQYTIIISNLSNTKDRDYFIHIDNKDYDSIFRADIQYIHQLQNAIYFAIKEEIKKTKTE